MAQHKKKMDECFCIFLVSEVDSEGAKEQAVGWMDHARETPTTAQMSRVHHKLSLFD
jgi:hypothetical protein